MRNEGRKTRFECRDETAHDNTFTDVVVGSIEKGLPVMLGWSTPDYGSHAVLVTGYWEGRERWLLSTTRQETQIESAGTHSKSRGSKTSKSAFVSPIPMMVFGRLGDPKI